MCSCDESHVLCSEHRAEAVEHERQEDEETVGDKPFVPSGTEWYEPYR